jgi:hypothetical protein
LEYETENNVELTEYRLEKSTVGSKVAAKEQSLDHIFPYYNIMNKLYYADTLSFRIVVADMKLNSLVRDQIVFVDVSAAPNECVTCE